MESEIEVTNYKTRNEAKDCLEPPETRNAEEGLSPSDFRGSKALPTP
jgi:hypothetical protein